MVAALACASSFPGVAYADTCHVGPPVEELGLGFHLSTVLELATYDNDRGAGNYQGVAVIAAYHREWLRLRAALPGYRLRRNDRTFYGPGDLLVGAELALIRDEEKTLASGISLAVTAPTGDAASDLGMGHVMVMPGVWGEVSRDKTFVQVQVVYGRALAPSDDQGAAQHAGHHASASNPVGPGPIVNPMNSSEITGRVSAGYRIAGPLRLRTGVDGAIPVAEDNGKSRGVAVVAVDLLPDPFDFTIEGQLPFAGNPFSAKAVVRAGFRF